VFDVPLLAARVRAALEWSEHRAELHDVPVGLFGASTGAAAALRAVASADTRVGAVVSRGGRPDLAEDALGEITCPVLLIVGGADRRTFELNEFAAARIRAPHLIQIVPGAGHLFEERGALERVAQLAVIWFERWLRRDRAPHAWRHRRSA
jgi:pimeloyl-ACP methyl ester carboxylesterase